MKNKKNKLKSESNVAIQVFYDGLCKVCSREINHYRKQQGAERIEFIDICAPGFDASDEGLDPLQVHKIMHVRRQDGTLATRVDAFIEIWMILPKYQWLARMARQSIVKAGLELGYSGFVMIRPLLPRYASAADCKDSPYCEIRNV